MATEIAKAVSPRPKSHGRVHTSAKFGDSKYKAVRTLWDKHKPRRKWTEHRTKSISVSIPESLNSKVEDARTWSYAQNAKCGEMEEKEEYEQQC